MTAVAAGARQPHVLVVDDEQGLRDMLRILFKREGYDVAVAASFKSGCEAVRGAPSPYELVLTDIMMPDGSGLDLLSLVKERSAQTEVLVMTAHSSVDLAVDAMRRGAYDFVTKPFATGELKALVHKALEKRALRVENVRLRARETNREEHERPKELVGGSEAMRTIFDLVGRIAPTRSTVLVTGASGTGKERIARAIHAMSDRADKPFLVVNCGAIPETLMESELFGHDKGAFTGATHRTLGIFREADGGTVLLDEVGELPAAVQVKLLRVLQERKVRAVGSPGEEAVDVRIVAATNRDVEADVKSGKFRQDLYYRLNVIRIEVPPLKERGADIRALAQHFLGVAAAEHGKELLGFSADALRALDAYPFPGNVRELENIVERAAALATSSTIGLGDLPRDVVGSASAPSPSLVELPADGCDLDGVMGEVERRLILQALERSGGVQTAAAKLLGVSDRSLRYRLQKLSLAAPGEEPEEPDSSQR